MILLAKITSLPSLRKTIEEKTNNFFIICRTVWLFDLTSFKAICLFAVICSSIAAHANRKTIISCQISGRFATIPSIILLSIDVVSCDLDKLSGSYRSSHHEGHQTAQILSSVRIRVELAGQECRSIRVISSSSRTSIFHEPCASCFRYTDFSSLITISDISSIWTLIAEQWLLLRLSLQRL